MFYVNGNNRIGMGHVKRCLALSEKLKTSIHCNIEYLMKDSVIGRETVRKYGYKTIEKICDKKLDVIITSLPQLSDEHMFQLRSKSDLLVCLDDSRRTQFSADIVIRGSIVPKLRECDSACDSKFLLGKDYMVLDKQFQEFHDNNRFISPNVKSILIAMGGSDINNYTLKVMDSLDKLDIDGIEKIVVIGPAFNNVERLINRNDYQFKYDVSNMAELMFEADIIIAGGGMVLYELACVGTPGIVISQTDYQLMEAKYFEKEGIIINLGGEEGISQEKIAINIRALLDNHDQRKKMSMLGKQLINGRALDKIVRIIQKELDNE